MTIKNKPLVFLDVETTGLKAHKHRITEIGAIKVHTDGTVEELNTLINPGIAIPEHITKITGITTEMVQGKPYFEDIKAQIKTMLRGSVIVAHNAVFDRNFITEEFFRHEDKITVEAICTMQLARELYPGMLRHRLQDVIEYMELPKPKNRHRAYDDALVVKWFFEILQERFSREVIERYGELSW